jgi:hypothetical protein
MCAVDGLAASDVQWGAVALPSLQPLVGAHLPHEFEAFLGRILGLARYLLLPDALPDTVFFSYWADATALVRAAAAASDRAVVVKSVTKQGACAHPKPQPRGLQLLLLFLFLLLFALL